MAAQSLETLRNSLMTSLFGRRLGLTADEFMAGAKDVKQVIEEIVSTAGSSLLPYGLTRFLTSGSSQTGSHTLQRPVPGVRKTITLDSSSTGIMVVYPTDALVFQSSGSSGSSVGSSVFSLRGNGAVVELMAVSTGLWRQLNSPSSAQALVLFSSST